MVTWGVPRSRHSVDNQVPTTDSAANTKKLPLAEAYAYMTCNRGNRCRFAD